MIKQDQNGKWDCIGLMGLAELYRSNRGQLGLYWTKRIYGSMYRTKRANRIIRIIGTDGTEWKELRCRPG
jgi:hypothetical protein